MNQNQDQDTRGQKLADCGLLMASPRVGASRPARSAKTVWEARKWARNDDARLRLIVADVPRWPGSGVEVSVALCRVGYLWSSSVSTPLAKPSVAPPLSRG